MEKAMSGKPERHLIWVPVIHTPEDLGTMSESIRKLYQSRLGKGKWDRRVQTVEAMWRRIRQEIEQLNLDYPKVRLYQDGLPQSGHEVDIVQDLARAGSENYRLLLELMAKGAQLTGTESPELLIEEYGLARQILAALGSGKACAGADRQQEVSKLLLDRRDRYIAERIGQTLAVGETGLIFLGMLHSLEGRLSPDIPILRLGQVVLMDKERKFNQNTGGPSSEQDKLATPSDPGHG